MKFRHRVVGTYPRFFILLAKPYPNLTDREIKFCALILFECSNQEIADRMGAISIDAVLTMKARLRKKFNLKGGERLRARLLRIADGRSIPPTKKKSMTHFR
jgi:DNA-binding CsgD family transcriptional regulator